MHKKGKELNQLLDIYEKELCNHIFKYQLNYKIDIEIAFYKENLCHLLGLQHIYGKNRKYLGINGYDKIKKNQLKRSDLFLRQENSRTNQYSPVSFVVKSDKDDNKE